MKHLAISMLGCTLLAAVAAIPITAIASSGGGQVPNASSGTVPGELPIVASATFHEEGLWMATDAGGLLFRYDSITHVRGRPIKVEEARKVLSDDLLILLRVLGFSREVREIHPVLVHPCSADDGTIFTFYDGLSLSRGDNELGPWYSSITTKDDPWAAARSMANGG